MLCLAIFLSKMQGDFVKEKAWAESPGFFSVLFFMYFLMDLIEDFINSKLPFPEAIVCANDSMAIAAIYYLAEHGFNVPGDVAVTGFDALPEALDHTPSITTTSSFSAEIKRCCPTKNEWYKI